MLYLIFDLFGDFLKHIGSADHNEWKLADMDIYDSKAKKMNMDNLELPFSLWLMPLYLPRFPSSCLINGLLTHHMGTLHYVEQRLKESAAVSALGPSQDAEYPCRWKCEIDSLPQICRFARGGKPELAFQV